MVEVFRRPRVLWVRSEQDQNQGLPTLHPRPPSLLNEQLCTPCIDCWARARCLTPLPCQAALKSRAEAASLNDLGPSGSIVCSMPDIVSIGGASCGFAYARDHVFRYLNDHLSDDSKAGTWSYPAYDDYQGAATSEVGDADLLAIALLNAGRQPLPSYYGLKKLVPEINERLRHPALNGALAQAEGEAIDAIVNLFNIVNDCRVPYVRLTTLTKVLHRKRPHMLPLFDLNIRRCYVYRGDSPPLAHFQMSESREFIEAWVLSVRKDLAQGAEIWEDFAKLAPGPQISSLRAMDIVGWELGRRPRDYFRTWVPEKLREQNQLRAKEIE